MMFRMKAISGFLMLFLSVSFVYSQDKPKVYSEVTEDDDVIYTPVTPLLVLTFSAWSKEEGYLKNLTHQDLEIYVDGIKQDTIYFLKAENLLNQKDIKENDKTLQNKFRFAIGIIWDSFMPKFEEDKIKVKIKLSKAKKKELRKVHIKIHKQELMQ